LCGQTPFKGRSDLETYNNIQKCEEIKFNKPGIDSKAKDLIEQLLTKEPSLRIGYESIEEIKSHPFFEGVDWSSVSRSKVPYNPTPLRKNVRLQKANMSSSFSNVDNKSPLLKSPSISATSSPCQSPMGRSKETPAACFGGAAAQ